MKARRRVFVLSGRAGDCISMCSCFHQIFLKTGIKPIVFTSTEFSGVFDGVSYVDVRPVNADWKNISEFEWEAIGNFGGAVTVQPWHDPDWSYESTGSNKVMLLIHGRNVWVDLDVDPDAGSAMARRCGFTREQWLSFPTVFDQRSPEREKPLVDRHQRASAGKPIILYNFRGISSPFGWEPEYFSTIRSLSREFHLVDLSQVRCTRIFDLLGLMEAASGIITIDTATLHLCSASPTPYIAFTAVGWSGSVARGNCVLSANYADSIHKLPDVIDTLRSWKAKELVNA